MPLNSESLSLSIRARFKEPAGWQIKGVICLLLAAGTAAAYWPVSGYGFLYCDDPDYVTSNSQVQGGLSWPGLLWALKSWDAANWHPLTWLSHMLDVQIFGMAPGWHHLTNVALHAATSLLLFALLVRITGAVWRSGAVAALFALHPLHVESVAWVAERKDVLSGCFFMLTLLGYAHYVREAALSSEPRAEVQAQSERAPVSSRPRRWYLLSLLFFALGLMSKPMLVTLPFVLLLLDWWPLQRLGRGHQDDKVRAFLPLLVEKLPFFAMSAGSAVVTFLAQQQAGSVTSATALPVGLRVENAMVSYAVYLKMLVWPLRLAAYYPHSPSFSVEAIATAVFVLVAISLLVAWLGKKRRYVIVGWLWYLGTLVPVIGLVQVGMQAMADRYMYLPVIGLLIIFVWGVSDFAACWRWHPAILPTASALALGTCLVLTARQVLFWKDSETVYRHALAVTSENALAHQNLGAALAEQGKVDEAWGHFSEALRIWPDYPEAQSNLGFLEFLRGNTEEAIRHYRAALKGKVGMSKTHFLLAMALAERGKRPDAVNEYRRALELEPNHEVALNNLAWILATDSDPQIRNGGEAVKLAERLCQLSQFRQAQYVGTLAAAYAEGGRFAEAVEAAQEAEKLAREANHTQLAARNRELLELYRAGKPYREPVAAVPVIGSEKASRDQR